MRKVCSARTIKAKLLQRDGEFALASEELLKLYRMGELICNGDGLMSCYLTGSGIRNSALSQLHEIIQSRRLESGALKAVHNTLLQAARKPEGLVQSCRVELFQFGLPFLEAFQWTGDCNQLIDQLIDLCYESTLFSDLDETSAKVDQQIRDERQSLRKQQLLQLLAGHPKPFDRDETIQILVRATSRYIAWLEFATRNPNSQWRHRLRDFMSKWHRSRLPRVAAWPTSLSPGFPLDLFGVDEVAEAARRNGRACKPIIIRQSGDRSHTPNLRHVIKNFDAYLIQLEDCWRCSKSPLMQARCVSSTTVLCRRQPAIARTKSRQPVAPSVHFFAQFSQFSTPGEKQVLAVKHAVSETERPPRQTPFSSRG